MSNNSFKNKNIFLQIILNSLEHIYFNSWFSNEKFDCDDINKHRNIKTVYQFAKWICVLVKKNLYMKIVKNRADI